MDTVIIELDEDLVKEAHTVGLVEPAPEDDEAEWQITEKGTQVIKDYCDKFEMRDTPPYDDV